VKILRFCSEASKAVYTRVLDDMMMQFYGRSAPSEEGQFPQEVERTIWKTQNRSRRKEEHDCTAHPHRRGMPEPLPRSQGQEYEQLS